jgi:hypothetical protein
VVGGRSFDDDALLDAVVILFPSILLNPAFRPSPFVGLSVCRPLLSSCVVAVSTLSIELFDVRT